MENETTTTTAVALLSQSTVSEDDLATVERMCSNLLRVFINSLFAGALCVFGFIGNSLSYFVLGRDQEMLPVARLLLRSLAVADNTFLLLYFIQFSVNELITYTGMERAVVWLYVRLATYPLLFVGQTATIWFTVLIAATRYVIVCHPTWGTLYCSLETTRRGVIAVVVFSIAYNAPRYFETRVQTERGPNGEVLYGLNHTELGGNAVYNFVYTDVLYYVFGFVLPLLLLSFFNIQLIVSYRNFRRKRAALRRRARTTAEDNAEQNVTLIMIVVILVFMLCNAPAKIVQIVLTYRIQPCMTAGFFVREISIVFEVLSSSVNFIVYCVCLKRFQDLLPCVVDGRPVKTREELQMMVTTSTTSGKADDSRTELGGGSAVLHVI